MPRLAKFKGAENALHPRAELLPESLVRKLAFQDVQLGTWQLAIDTNYLHLDDAAGRILGHSEENGCCALNNLIDRVHVDDRRDLSLRLELSASAGIPVTCSFRIRDEPAEIRWLELTANRTQTPTGDLVSFGTLRDVTQEKKRSDALGKSQSGLHAILEQSMVGVLSMDRDLNLLMVNDRFLSLVGRTREEITGLSFVDYTHPDDLEWNAPLFREKCAKGEPFTVEKRYVRPDGSEVWCAVNVSFVSGPNEAWTSTIVFAHEITDRKLARDKLRDNEMRLRISQEAGRIGTFVVDRNGVAHASQQYYEILGVPEHNKHTGNMDWTSVVHPDDLDRILAEISEADRKRQTYQEAEYRIVRPNDNEVRWIHARLTCERDDDGKMLRVAGAMLDVTDSKLVTEQLRQTESLNNGIITSSADCIKVLDLDGTLRFMSPKGVETMEVEDGDALIGKRWQDLWPEEVSPVVQEAINRASAGKIGRFDAGLVTARGNAKWADVVVTPLTNESGDVTQLLSITRDITEIREKAEQVRWAAEHDALTRLPNRNCFDQRLDKALASAKNTGEKIGLLALDVDNFKFVNDAFGHDAGDTLLKAISARLEQAIEDDDFVARLGGDEFSLVARHLEKGRDILEIGRAIDAAMKEPVPYKDNLLDCRVSIGAATSPEHGTQRDEFLKCADIALYAAKSSGPNRVLLYDSSQRSELDRRSVMIALARMALDRDDIVPFYQPKLCLRSGQVVGFEALLRWRDLSGSIRLPGDIDAAFEDFELAHLISEKMQDCVIRDLKGWQDAGVDIGHVAINLAAAEFSRNDVAARLLNKLEEACIPPRHLQVEVTETVFLGRGADHVRKALFQFKKHGVEIALDDFGTGFASLTHLKEFPVNIIKIDRSFIADLGKGPGDTAIVCALISLARELGMTTVAEGIENDTQAKFLQREGCDLGQGFLFGKPVPSENVPAVREVRRHRFIGTC